MNGLLRALLIEWLKFGIWLVENWNCRLPVSRIELSNEKNDFAFSKWISGHVSTVRGLAVSPTHPYLFSCGEDRQVKCWDLEYNKVTKRFPLNSIPMRSYVPLFRRSFVTIMAIYQQSIRWHCIQQSMSWLRQAEIQRHVFGIWEQRQTFTRSLVIQTR